MSTATPQELTLENGDVLTRAEFYRRWEAMPHVTRAERIEGRVLMPAAVRWKEHGDQDGRMTWWLKHYQVHTPGTDFGPNSSVQLDLDNDPQPDAFLRISPACGGQSGTSADGYVTGAPELVAEVAASSVSLDLHDKLDVYRRNGVQEYLVWKVLDEEIVWFRLREGEFVAQAADDSGVLSSDVFPGLRLDVSAMIGDDTTRALRVLQDGIDSDEHRAFVDELQQSGREN